MYFDKDNTIVFEQSAWPGSIGDSCAETARHVHMLQVLGIPYSVDLTVFKTRDGYIRHPTAPGLSELYPGSESWRETDFTSDQALPLYLASSDSERKVMLERIKAAGWKTGNGKYIPPVFFALMKSNKTLLAASVYVQTLLFKLPFRWSDSKGQFENTKDNSGDYLNWMHSAVYAPQWARAISPEVLKEKVREYYRAEPNSKFLIDIYDRFIDQEF